MYKKSNRMRILTMNDIRKGNNEVQNILGDNNAIKMNVDGQPNRRYIETDEVSVIARGRACVRTEQYRHSEVMRSVGRSHIQRCERAAVAQAMTHATTWSRNPILVLGRDRRAEYRCARERGNRGL